jgi:hypothetical protein
MEVKFWDDWLDDKFIFNLDYNSNFYNWNYNCISNRRSFPNKQKGTGKFLGAIIYEKKKEKELNPKYKELGLLFDFINEKLLNSRFNSNQINAITLNGQFVKQDGFPHLDIAFAENPNSKNYTIMVFINHKWQKEWGGEFEILDSPNTNPQILKTIDYIPGRIIFFDGNMYHRGLAPKLPGIFRKSLVYRIVVNN